MSLPDKHLESLVASLHRQGKLSVWSIVITIFGDAIVPRGGVIALSSLQEIMSRLNIEPNALRTALSRLARDGWITRIKHGRQSFYELAASGRDLFASATQRIYAGNAPGWSGEFEMAIRLHQKVGVNSAIDKAMSELGFGSPMPNFYLRPKTDVATQELPDNVISFTGRDVPSDELSKMVAAAWPIEQLEEQYEALLTKYSPLFSAWQEQPLEDPLNCLAARILLIHDWRRVCLKDPNLPHELRPKYWVGDACREMTGGLYSLLSRNSEEYLDSCYAVPTNKLPRPDIDVSKRFKI